MKKMMVVLVLLSILVLAGCQQQTVKCGAGTSYVDGQCVVPTEDDTPLVCETGYELNDTEDACVLIDTEEPLVCTEGYELNDAEDACVLIEEPLVCDTGYHEEFGTCVLDNPDLPDWFTGWGLLREPIGDFSLSALNFTETGFSMNLPVGKRVGVQKTGLQLQAGYAYEVSFDYNSDVAGLMIFVQLQGHGGNHITFPSVMTSETTQTFSQTLAMSPASGGTNDGWFTIELLPNGVAGTITIENIQLIETALPTCGDNEVLKGLECVAANNGYTPNGTPTEWFTGWEILTGPAGNKDISDYHFSETGFTAYLDHGERTGIQFMNYTFEPGYDYELSFTVTATEPNRMIWVQMEALGGYGFTNTETWTTNGTITFTQTLRVPSTYNPVEPGWIKLEITPGALDNVTIENIVITKTPIS